DEAIAGKKAGFKTNVIHIHNWEKGIFEPKANITIDWTKYFDRSIKKVPDSTLWDDVLVPEIVAAKNKLANKTSVRHITFRGKCALSTGISLGMIFPEIGNWTFELMQPPLIDPWRSDAEKKLKYKPIHSEISPSTLGIKSKGDELAIVFNITGKALSDVAGFFKSSAMPLKKIITIQPEAIPGTLSIKNDSEAVALASASKDIIKRMITKYNSKKIHLFYFGPYGLAVFLGQKLTSVGSIQLYEFQDPGYKPSCLLKS
ncbi:MAG TPA: SAVED domain-containing protein, partial [Niabella sp.]|nr:SAVED domain-containing protein [Niabella sp.]